MSKQTPSFFESNSEKATNSLGNNSDSEKKRERVDRKQFLIAACFVTSALFWLLALFLSHPKPFWVVKNAFAVLAVCFTIDAALANQTGLESHVLLSHYALGVLIIVIYIVIFNISPRLYAAVWTSFFFGYYLFTWISLLTKKEQFSPVLRILFTLRHSAAFIITGIWIFVAPCCFEDNNDFIYRAIVIWISSDAWGNLLNIYKILRRKPDGEMVHKMQVVVFCLERTQNIVAYFQILTVPASALNILWWVVASSGLFMDCVDTFFQLKSICKHYQANEHETTVPVGDIESPVLDRRATDGKPIDL